MIPDARSAKDKTCLIYHQVRSMPPGEPEKWDESIVITEWKFRRVELFSRVDFDSRVEYGGRCGEHI